MCRRLLHRDAYNLIQQNLNNPGFIIIDVRTADEFNSGHIAGAINIDYESPQFTADVSKLDKNKQYLVYCATGIRGAAATQIMISLGFKDVQNMAGGITAWIQDGYPTVDDNHGNQQRLCRQLLQHNLKMDYSFKSP